MIDGIGCQTRRQEQERVREPKNARHVHRLEQRDGRRKIRTQPAHYDGQTGHQTQNKQQAAQFPEAPLRHCNVTRGTAGCAAQLENGPAQPAGNQRDDRSGIENIGLRHLIPPKEETLDKLPAVNRGQALVIQVFASAGGGQAEELQEVGIHGHPGGSP